MKKKIVIFTLLATIFIGTVTYFSINKAKKDVSDIKISNKIKKDIKKEQSTSSDKVLKIENNKDLTDFEIITKFVDYINNKNYAAALSMFNPDYRKDFEITEDSLRIKYNFNKLSFAIISKEKADKDMILMMKLYDNGDITKYIPSEFTVFDDGTIADRGVFVVRDIYKTAEISGIKYEVLRCYNSLSRSTYIIDITNKSEKELIIDNNNNYGFYAKDDEIVYRNKSMLDSNYSILPSDNKTRFTVEMNVKNPETIGVQLAENINNNNLKYNELENGEKKLKKVDIMKVN